MTDDVDKEGQKRDGRSSSATMSDNVKDGET